MAGQDYRWVMLVTAISLLIYYLSMVNAGVARVRYKVAAPSHDGPEDYLRRVRTHLNTLEHLALFLPAMWLFAVLVSAKWAAILGLSWSICRLIYIVAYTRSAEARRYPFYVSMLSIYVYLAGSLFASVMAVITNR